MRIRQINFTKQVSFFVFVFILSLLVSCSAKPEDAIIGEWTAIDKDNKEDVLTISFLKDGTAVMFYSMYPGMAKRMYYSFMKQRIVRLFIRDNLFKVEKTIAVAEISKSGKKLVWSDVDEPITLELRKNK